MGLLKEIIQAIFVKIGFTSDKTVDPVFRLRQRRVNRTIFIALLLHLALSPVFWGTPCLIQGMLGIPCPTCGSTRAAFHLLRGNLKEALYWHPLIVLSLIILIAAMSSIIRQEVLKQRAFAEHRDFSVKYAGKKLWGIFIPVLILYLIVYLIRLRSLYPEAPMNFNEFSLLGRVISLIKNLIG